MWYKISKLRLSSFSILFLFIYVLYSWSSYLLFSISFSSHVTILRIRVILRPLSILGSVLTWVLVNCQPSTFQSNTDMDIRRDRGTVHFHFQTEFISVLLSLFTPTKFLPLTQKLEINIFTCRGPTILSFFFFSPSQN